MVEVIKLLNQITKEVKWMSRRVFSYIVIGLAIIFIVLGFVSPILVRNFVVIEEMKLNEITTWITGGMSACFSLSSICLVIVTLNINSGNEKIHQFQNRFFKWKGRKGKYV